jgi:hypothetical protein
VQSYEKTREEQKKHVSFFFRVPVTSPRSGKVTKSREQYKINIIYFFCRDAVTSRCRRKVTNIVTTQIYARITSQKLNDELTMLGDKLNESFSNIKMA